jgi:hypothetical protein
VFGQLQKLLASLDATISSRIAHLYITLSRKSNNTKLTYTTGSREWRERRCVGATPQKSVVENGTMLTGIQSEKIRMGRKNTKNNYHSKCISAGRNTSHHDERAMPHLL